MREIIDFKAYAQDTLALHVWVVKGTITERVEREVFQDRLDRGDFTRVDVIEAGQKVDVMLKQERG